MFKKLAVATLATGALFIASGAYADTLTAPQVDTFGPQQTNFTSTLTFNQFDPTAFGGALLNSLHIELDGTDSASATTVTCAATGGDGHCIGSVSSQITMTLSAPGVGTLVVVVPTTTTSFDITGAGNSQVISVASNNATAFADYFLSNSTLTAGLIADFQGGGTISLSLGAVGSNTITNTDGASFNLPAITTTGSGTATVTYGYDVPAPPDVPEPATIALLGAGLAGIGALRRRAKKS